MGTSIAKSESQIVTVILTVAPVTYVVVVVTDNSDVTDATDGTFVIVSSSIITCNRSTTTSTST